MTTLERAYSLLEVKSLDEDKRMISGMASTPETDRVGDIVEPLGAKYAAEVPLLWQHKHDQPVGWAVLGKATKQGIPFTASIAKLTEEGPLKNMVDMVWQAVKAKLVRGVSIGFLPRDRTYLNGGGSLLKSIEIFELSLVTIPANAATTIQTIKALDYRRDSSGGAVRLITRAAEPPRDTRGAIALCSGSLRLHARP